MVSMRGWYLCVDGIYAFQVHDTNVIVGMLEL
jgi:hypothetical protein